MRHLETKLLSEVQIKGIVMILLPKPLSFIYFCYQTLWCDHSYKSCVSMEFGEEVRDVICKNPAYWGANSAFLDPPFPCIHIQRLFLNCTESEKSVFCRFSYDKKSRLWSEAAQNVRRLIRSCSFSPSIIQVFPEDVTYVDHASLCTVS